MEQIRRPVTVMSEKTHLLVIDDEKNYLLVLQTLLEDEGYAVTAVSDPETALAFLNESEVDVVVTDMKMPKVTGREVLQRVKKNWSHIPVLIMTAFGSIESAVEVMKYGAFDYITKPFSNDELLLSIHNAAELSRTHRQYRLLLESMEERYGLHQIVGRSQAIRDVLVMIDRVAPSRSTLLITGESGTGKELVARAIHYTSPRKDKPFISVNCMALNAGVLESELFGHEKGSFTGAVAMRRGRFEQADGGTLFLDEIAELTQDLQVKLLRVLQERRFERVGGSEGVEVDIRVVAATNKNLAALVEQGAFRDDLYYRLNVVQIPLPPLRERREDIFPLVAHFMEKVTAENNMSQKTFSAEALNYLVGYEWPGNIRQLENVVESCMVLVPGAVIEVDNLPPEIRDEEAQFKSAVDLLPVQLDLADTLEKIEAALIRRALVRSELVQVKAAECLGISKSLLQYKLKKYGITGH
jgi:two-component system NtrC family response regulator